MAPRGLGGHAFAGAGHPGTWRRGAGRAPWERLMGIRRVARLRAEAWDPVTSQPTESPWPCRESDMTQARQGWRLLPMALRCWGKPSSDRPGGVAGLHGGADHNPLGIPAGRDTGIGRGFSTHSSQARIGQYQNGHRLGTNSGQLIDGDPIIAAHAGPHIPRRQSPVRFQIHLILENACLGKPISLTSFSYSSSLIFTMV